MSSIYYTGEAPLAAQVSTSTFGVYDASTTRKITIGGVVVQAVDSGSTLTAALAALAVLLNASTHPYFAACTWTSNATQIIGTADNPGIPFTFAGSVTGGTGTVTNAFTTSTANGSPNQWSLGTNWSGGAVPVSTDDVTVGPNKVICWGIDVATVAPAYLRVSKGAHIGLPLDSFTTTINQTTRVLTGSTAAREYRTDFLRIIPAKIIIVNDESNPPSTSLIKIDNVTTAVDDVIYGSAAVVNGRAPIRRKGTHASSTMEIYGGQVEFCMETPADTGQVASVSVFSPGASFTAGPGLTQATHNQQAGNATLHNVPTTVTVEKGANVRMDGAGTITTLNKRGDVDSRGATLAVTTMTG